MNILIGILAYALGFVSCIIFVRFVVKINKYSKKIQKAEEILKREEEKKKVKKTKCDKVIKMAEDETKDLTDSDD